METTHTVHAADARELTAVETDSVDLVVTSPPYPMVDMWDDLFSTLDPGVGDALEDDNGEEAFERMHSVLDAVWDELERVVVPGGIVCLNIGDATRSVDGQFRVFPNHARCLDAMERRGFQPLPDILWHKPTNSAAKFMGSGMVPPSAYITLEHEYILIFRNGNRRSFDPGADRRYEAAYFWEERNQWFTDIWTDVRGRLQSLPPDDLRDRSGAFPFEIPYRLCNMYSVYGDTVLDPFWGTGTTTLAAMIAGRNSIGYELDEQFIHHFETRLESVPDISADVLRSRLDNHRTFVQQRIESGDTLSYDAVHYEFPVVTKQEQRLRFYEVVSVERDSERGGPYHVSYRPFE